MSCYPNRQFSQHNLLRNCSRFCKRILPQIPSPHFHYVMMMDVWSSRRRAACFKLQGEELTDWLRMEWWSLMAMRPAVGASSDTIPSQYVPLWAGASARTFHQAMVMSVGGRPHSWLGKYGRPVGHRRAQSVPLHTICFHGLCGNVRQKHKNLPNAQSVPYYDEPFWKALSFSWVEDLDAQCTWTCSSTFLGGSGNHTVIK